MLHCDCLAVSFTEVAEVSDNTCHVQETEFIKTRSLVNEFRINVKEWTPLVLILLSMAIKFDCYAILTEVHAIEEVLKVLMLRKLCDVSSNPLNIAVLSDKDKSSTQLITANKR